MTSLPDLHTFSVSTGMVDLAEIGDKTQLLALLLAARFQRAGPMRGSEPRDFEREDEGYPVVRRSPVSEVLATWERDDSGVLSTTHR